jgi:hypothetical protein
MRKQMMQIGISSKHLAGARFGLRSDAWPRKKSKGQ